jgi:hypothetical protein
MPKRQAPTAPTSSLPKVPKKPRATDPPPLTKVEEWDQKLLNKIISLVDLPDETVSALKGIRSALNKRGKLTVEYKASNETGFGRLYGPGLQGLPGWIRRLVREDDHDIDIKNCAPSFWTQVAERELGPRAAPHMRNYVDNRDAVLEEEMGHLPRGKAKQAVLTILHGGQPADGDEP